MNNRGIVLPVTLAFVLAFTLLGFSTIYLSTLQNEAAERRIASEKAFWLAEAGIQKGLWEYKYNSCHGLVSQTSGTTCSKCDSCGEKIWASANSEMDGHYNLKMTSASSAVTATGSYPSRTPALNRTQRTVQFASTSQFDYALFAKDQIRLKNGATVDSYNSTLGSYGPGNQGSNGDIGSNGTISKGDDAAIFLQGFNLNPIVIKGDVSTGPGGNIYGFGLDEKEMAQIVKGEITHENNVDLPPVVVPSSLTGLAQQKDKDLDITDTHTIREGDYKYSSISVVNNGNLIIDGHVRIYLTETNSHALNVWNHSEVTIKKNSSLTLYTDGEVSVTQGSNINNLTKDPKKLTIYSTVSNSKKNNTEGIDIWGNSDFYGAIYAPGAHVFIDNNSGIFGSFVAEDFLIPIGVELHYDESLAGRITDSTVIWREISNGLVP